MVISQNEVYAKITKTTLMLSTIILHKLTVWGSYEDAEEAFWMICHWTGMTRFDCFMWMYSQGF